MTEYRHLLALLALVLATPAVAADWPAREADFTVRDFRFQSGETLPELRIHYTTLGTPHRGADWKIDNAVMVLHGTGGTGKQFLAPQFADELYGPGAPFDIAKTFVILPDNIGHGGSSRPSDGLRMAFPKYDYADMIEAQRRMLAEGLGVKRLVLHPCYTVGYGSKDHNPFPFYALMAGLYGDGRLMACHIPLDRLADLQRVPA